MSLKPPLPPNTLLDYRHVYDEGTQQTAEDGINFTGAGVTVTDDPTNHRLVVTIPGGSVGTGDEPYTVVDGLSGTPRSVTDWGPLINTALTNGTRRFLFGAFDYPFTTMIDGHNIHSISFMGSGGQDYFDTGSSTGKTRLLWGGTGSGHAIDFSSTSIGPATGPVLEDLALLYSSASYTGALVTFKNSGFATVNRCYFGAKAGSAAASTPSALCALALDGINTIDVNDSTFGAGQGAFNSEFTGGAIRGRESGGAGFTNVVRCTLCTFHGKAVWNPGLDWVLDQCIFELETPEALSAITTDFTYPAGDQIQLTLNECAYWDCANAANKVVDALAGISWDFAANFCTDHCAGGMAKLYDFQCNGTVRITGGKVANVVDLGDGTDTTKQKNGVTILGVNFESASANLLTNATKGHVGVTILAGSLHFGNFLGVADGVLTLGHEIANIHDVPSLSVHAGATGISVLELAKGNDMAGVIVIANTSGSPSSTGLIVDVTMANPPYSTQEAAASTTKFPIVVLTPLIVDGGGVGFNTGDGPKSAACHAYAYTKSLANGGSQGAWSIGIGVAIPASSNVAYAYRVIHI